MSAYVTGFLPDYLKRDFLDGNKDKLALPLHEIVGPL